MHAIAIETTGGPEALHAVEVAEPQAGPGDVIVDVAFAGVNFIDTYHRAGLYPLALPAILGLEGSGVVRTAGPGAVSFSEGDRVAWTGHLGSYAAVAAIAEDSLVAVPDSVALDDAAAVMLQGLTAHYLVNDTFPLRDGHRCLIHAGAGGVGRLLIQLAKGHGAEVFATAGGSDKTDIAAQCGADHVIDYSAGDFGAAIEAVAGPRPLDVVYDGVGAPTFDRGLELLAPLGMMVAYGNAGGPVPPVDPLRLSRNGSLFLTRPTLFDYIAEPETLRTRCADLFAAITRGDLNVLVGARFPLAAAADAHRALEGRTTTGKTLLEL